MLKTTPALAALTLSLLLTGTPASDGPAHAAGVSAWDVGGLSVVRVVDHANGVHAGRDRVPESGDSIGLDLMAPGATPRTHAGSAGTTGR